MWLVYRKKLAGGEFAHGEIVDEALCFGWIDSVPRKLDDVRSMLLLSPRKAGSSWSKVKRTGSFASSPRGLCRPRALPKWHPLKKDGSWRRLAAVDALEEPHDLSVALNGVPNAANHWAAFLASTRRGILEWILNAKTAITRAKRIAETAHLVGENKRANQWPR